MRLDLGRWIRTFWAEGDAAEGAAAVDTAQDPGLDASPTDSPESEFGPDMSEDERPGWMGPGADDTQDTEIPPEGAEPKGDDKGETESKDDGLSEAVLKRAEAAGLTKDMAEGLGDKLEGVLVAFDRKQLDAFRKERATAPQGSEQPLPQPKAAEQPAAAQPKALEAPTPSQFVESWSQGLAENLAKKGFAKDAADSIAESLKGLGVGLEQALEKRFSERVGRIEHAENERLTTAWVGKFEESVGKLNPELFGKAPPAKDTPAWKARQKVFLAMDDFLDICAAKKQQPPQFDELIRRAYFAEFPDKIQSHARKQIASQLSKQKGTHAIKPTQRKSAPSGKKSTPQSRAEHAVGQILDAAGYDPEAEDSLIGDEDATS